MKDIYVYGAGRQGKDIVELVDKYYSNRIHINAIIDSMKYGSLGKYPIIKIDSVPLTEIIIIAIRDDEIVLQIYRDLIKKGYTNIFKYNPRKSKHILNFEDLCMDLKYREHSYLKQVEMHVMDGCNLNCKGCSHFAPLCNKTVPDMAMKVADVRQLHRVIKHIDRFYLLGGEPFLNPQIGEYIKEIYQIMPKTEIVIVTNGILIPNLKEDLLKLISDYGVLIIISAYPPVIPRLNHIIKVLENYDIVYEIRNIEDKGFNKPLALSSDSKHERLCISDGCTMLHDGKIARCPTVMMVDNLNEEFETSFPTTGKYDIYTSTADEIMLGIKKIIPLCKYCIKNPMTWEQCGKKTCLDDFVEVDF